MAKKETSDEHQVVVLDEKVNKRQTSLNEEGEDEDDDDEEDEDYDPEIGRASCRERV